MDNPDTKLKPADVYVVLTSNNDPDFATFSVERGEFARYEDATVLATELAEMGETARIEAREWVPIKRSGCIEYKQKRRLAGEFPDVERATIQKLWREAYGFGPERGLAASGTEWKLMLSLLRTKPPLRRS